MRNRGNSIWYRIDLRTELNWSSRTKGAQVPVKQQLLWSGYIWSMDEQVRSHRLRRFIYCSEIQRSWCVDEKTGITFEQAVCRRQLWTLPVSRHLHHDAIACRCVNQCRHSAGSNDTRRCTPVSVATRLDFSCYQYRLYTRCIYLFLLNDGVYFESWLHGAETAVHV